MTCNVLCASLFTYHLSLLTSSCSDFFDIKPQTELVSDDFWQTKSDVESAVAA